MNKLQFFFIGFIASLVVPHLALSAEDLPGTRDSIYSNILKENRVIQVVLPEDFKSDEKYDVLYLLDGESNVKLVTQIQQFMMGESFIPQTIVVAIVNVDRNRDFTPTHVESNSTSGGGDKFLSFLKEELVPYVNKKHPTSGENILYGHSLGGLFSTYAFLKEPQLFQTYIAVDPSYWWDNRFLVKLTKQKISSSLSLNQSLYITGREGKGYTGMGIEAMDSVLKEKAPKTLKWKSVAYKNETHNSIKFKSIYDGLRFTYAGYDAKVEFHPMNGIVQKDKPFKIWSFSEHDILKYTLDGSEPTVTSPKLEPEITCYGPTQFKVRPVANRGSYSKTLSGEFKDGKVLPAVSKPKNLKAGGFKYSYYEGEWTKLPDFKKLTPVKTGTIDKDFNFSKLPKSTNFGLLFEGYFEVKTDGYYVFGVGSDDGSKLYISNQLIIDFDGLHANENRSFILPLEKGFYPLRLEYFQKDGGKDLDLVYITPDKMAPEPQQIPFELQYSRNDR